MSRVSSLPLVVGVPRETKTDEHRVAITPDGVLEMTHRDVPVVIEAGAGSDSGISDDDYRGAGAEIVTNAGAVWERADLVLKVKEPQAEEFRHLRPGLVLFTYLHLAAYPDVAHALIDARTVAIGYETVQRADGQLPLLVPMSEVAGRMAPQIGAHFLERRQGGRGVLGLPGLQFACTEILISGTRKTLSPRLRLSGAERRSILCLRNTSTGRAGECARRATNHADGNRWARGATALRRLLSKSDSSCLDHAAPSRL